MSQTIFERMIAGGIIRNDEMSAAWEVVARAQRLSPALNASTTMDEMRERLSELIESEIDKSTTVFVPFHTNFGKHIKLVRMYSSITLVVFSISEESPLKTMS